jgi:hypothetical protein
LVIQASCWLAWGKEFFILDCRGDPPDARPKDLAVCIAIFAATISGLSRAASLPRVNIPYAAFL